MKDSNQFYVICFDIFLFIFYFNVVFWCIIYLVYCFNVYYGDIKVVYIFDVGFNVVIFILDDIVVEFVVVVRYSFFLGLNGDV